MNTMNETERKEIEELLPWHAAGTLSRRDAQRVEAALANDPELARRYALAREELGQTIHLNETLGAPSARAMEKLFAKIDAEPARRPAISSGFGARFGEFFSGLAPRTLAWSAAVAIVAIVLQAGFIADMVVRDKGPSGYQTASVPGAAQGEGSYALIRFQPQASAADVTKFLETNKLSLAGGPTAGGLYKVQLAPAALAKDQRAALIKKLQDDKVVGFIAASE
jgi:anti-sigma factor RsiW